MEGIQEDMQADKQVVSEAGELLVTSLFNEINVFPYQATYETFITYCIITFMLGRILVD